MGDLRTAAQQALEAYDKGLPMTAAAAMSALRAALERWKPLSADSLARALVAARIIDAAAIDDPDGYDDGIMLARVQALHRRLCAEQQEPVPLTEDEIERLIQTYSGYGLDDIVSVARAVERAHGIGGEHG